MNEILKKKQTHRRREQTSHWLPVNGGGQGGSIEAREWEELTIGCKISCEDVVYKRRNIVNIV